MQYTYMESLINIYCKFVLLDEGPYRTEADVIGPLLSSVVPYGTQY